MLKPSDFLIDPLDDLTRILAKAHNDDSANRLAAIEVDGSAAESRAHLNSPKIADSDGNALARQHDRFLDVLNGLRRVLVGTDEASPPDDEFHAAGLDGFGADIEVGILDGFDQSVERYVVKPQLVRVDLNLILPHVAANAGDFADSVNGLQFVLHNEVLQAAQLGEVHAGPWFEYVIKDLSEPRSIRPEDRDDALRETRSGSAELLCHARGGPVPVDIIRKRDLDEAVTEQTFASHTLRIRHGEQSD